MDFLSCFLLIALNNIKLFHSRPCPAHCSTDVMNKNPTEVEQNRDRIVLGRAASGEELQVLLEWPSLSCDDKIECESRKVAVAV